MKILIKENRLYLFLIVIFFVSTHIQCINGFENVIEIDEDLFEEKLVVTAQFYVDSVPSMTISNNINISNNDFPIIDNATVNVIVNNENYPFEFNEQTLKYHATTAFDLQTMSNYELQINHPNLGSVFAEQLLLSNATNIEVSPSEDIYNSDSTLNSASELTLSFKDTRNEENYYIIEVESIGERPNFETGDTTYGKILTGINSPSNLVEFQSIWRLYLRDDNLDGETITIPFSYFSRHDIVDAIKVNLISTTREGYLHELSVAKYQESLDNPFVEPVIIFSNIENGLGIFSLNHLNTFSFP